MISLGYILIVLAVVLWVAFIILLGLSSQTSKARIKRRLYFRQTEEEAERRKNQEAKSNEDANIVRRYDETSFVNRVLRPMLKALSEQLSHFAPSELSGMLENQIFRMGKQDSWSVTHLAACWVLSVAAGFFLTLMFVISKPELLYPQGFIMMIMGTVGGAVLPFFILQSIIKQRKEKLRNSLPEFIDLVCISVQAGLSFDAAVSKITDRMKGPLSEEFLRMARDIRHGMTRQRSLTQLAKRCDIEEMYLFTTSVIQADKLGTSMGRTLKLQADNMRDRYRQTIKAKAMKAPVKIIFPMVIFIFPSIFVIVLLPIVMNIASSFGK